MPSPFDINYLHLYSDVELLSAYFAIEFKLYQVLKSIKKTFGTGAAFGKNRNPINIKNKEGQNEEN
jgi:hypothetical protein